MNVASVTAGAAVVVSVWLGVVIFVVVSVFHRR